ncbi:MAG: DMT family transporter [Rhodospirillales bacterium]|nr:DMT family transporter [Rhodospirillales bacterium]
MSGNLAGIIAIIMWSVANLLVTYTGSVPAFFLGFLVMVPGGAALLGWDICKGQKLKAICHQSAFTYAITLCGIGGYILLQYIAFKIASPFEINVINYTWPLFLSLFAVLIYKDGLTANRIIGLTLGFIGMVLIFSDRMEGFQVQEWLGYSLSLIGAMLFGLYSALTRKTHLPSGFIGLVFMIAGMFSLGLHMMFETTIWPHNIMIWLSVIGLGIVRIAYVLWDFAMTKGDTVMLASLAYMLPFFSAMLFIVAGHMPLSTQTAVAGAMIITGCLTTNLAKTALLYNKGLLRK